MKRFIFHFASVFGKITLLLLTFVVGIASTILLSEIFPPTVTLCQLEQNPTWYAWRTVRVEADSFSFGAIFITDKNCNPPDIAASGVWRAEGYEPSAEVQKLYSEPDSKIYKARLLVTERFDPNATMGCFAPKSAIRATSIELKSEIATEPMKRRQE